MKHRHSFLAQVPESVMKGIVLAFGHAVVFTLALLIGVTLWARTVASTDAHISLHGLLLVAVGLIYVISLIILRWWYKLRHDP